MLVMATTVRQARVKYGFLPVYSPMSNKCLLHVNYGGAVAKYIPQSSRTEELHAIKGKRQRGDWLEAARHHLRYLDLNAGCAVSRHTARCSRC